MLRRIFMSSALLLAFFGATTAQEKAEGGIIKEEVPLKTSLGRMGLGLPAPTSKGSWEGTWIYVSRDVRMALWMRETDGKPETKFRFESMLASTETFETDWTGSTTYFVQDRPARFSFTMSEAGKDRIEGDWDWMLDMRGSSRSEKSDVEMYRAGDGRRLVMHFKNFLRTVESGGRRRIFDSPQAWTFRKLSRRQALWEELPF